MKTAIFYLEKLLLACDVIRYTVLANHKTFPPYLGAKFELKSNLDISLKFKCLWADSFKQKKVNSKYL